ncbi:MAG: SLC13 family permease [Xanthomonadales bacterium]|nr:SLC13 family permease [Xanthomonadales bacterium]
MSWQIGIALAVTSIVFFGFVREKWPPEVTAFAGVSLLLATGTLPSDSLLAVFSNSAPMTIAAMFVLSAALERTGVITLLGRWATRLARGSWLRAILIILVPVIGMSAFINNTPVVVILTPVLIALARSSAMPASKLLIPLSFLSIFGGTCTLLGTSTNLLVDGLVRAQGLPGFGLFEISSVGLIMALAGSLYLVLFGWWLLPNRNPPVDAEQLLRQRRFMTDFLVPVGSSLRGKRLAETPLARVPGARVLDVLRGNYSLKRSLDSLQLTEADRLIIECSADDVPALRALALESRSASPGLQAVSTTENQIIEAIVGPESRITGSAISELDLPGRFGVYPIAVHRHKRPLARNFDQLRLKVGDILLLEGSGAALARLADSPQFINVSTPKLRPVHTDKASLAMAIMVGVVVVATVSSLPLVAVAVVGATLAILTRCIDPDDIYEAIQWPILMLIYGMLAIGKALENTGAMAYLVELLFVLVKDMGPVAVLAVLYILTSILTEVMSNNAAAILITPIAIGLADSLGIDARPLVVAVMLAGSASFATPIGYQTNTFVYRAGNYRFVDFARIGIPLNLLLWAIAVYFVPRIWPFHAG